MKIEMLIPEKEVIRWLEIVDKYYNCELSLVAKFKRDFQVEGE